MWEYKKCANKKHILFVHFQLETLAVGMCAVNTNWVFCCSLHIKPSQFFLLVHNQMRPNEITPANCYALSAFVFSK